MMTYCHLWLVWAHVIASSPCMSKVLIQSAHKTLLVGTQSPVILLFDEVTLRTTLLLDRYASRYCWESTCELVYGNYGNYFTCNKIEVMMSHTAFLLAYLPILDQLTITSLRITYFLNILLIQDFAVNNVFQIISQT